MATGRPRAPVQQPPRRQNSPLPANPYSERSSHATGHTTRPCRTDQQRATTQTSGATNPDQTEGTIAPTRHMHAALYFRAQLTIGCRTSAPARTATPRQCCRIHLTDDQGAVARRGIVRSRTGLVALVIVVLAGAVACTSDSARRSSAPPRRPQQRRIPRPTHPVPPSPPTRRQRSCGPSSSSSSASTPCWRCGSPAARCPGPRTSSRSPRRRWSRTATL
jgi:hypothetical protein